LAFVDVLRFDFSGIAESHDGKNQPSKRHIKHVDERRSRVSIALLSLSLFLVATDI